MAIPDGLRRLRYEPVGGRPGLWLHGGPGVIRPRPGCLSGRESQGRCDQRRHDGQVEQGVAGATGALREENRKKAIKREAEREARVEQYDLRDGTTLNKLLNEIFDGDPAVARSGRAKMPLSPSAIREIPFEWDSEAITVCIDQMTGKDALPSILMRPTYVEERNALRSAVEPALAEDAKGSVSIEARKKIADAVSSFRARFLKSSNDFDDGYQDALDCFTTLASLTRLLNDPSMKSFLSQLDNGQERTVGDLIVFMNAYNLRFGPATSDHQLEIYTRLVPALTAIRDAPSSEKAAAPSRIIPARASCPPPRTRSS